VFWLSTHAVAKQSHLSRVVYIFVRISVTQPRLRSTLAITLSNQYREETWRLKLTPDAGLLKPCASACAPWSTISPDEVDSERSKKASEEISLLQKREPIYMVQGLAHSIRACADTRGACTPCQSGDPRPAGAAELGLSPASLLLCSGGARLKLEERCY